MAILQATNGTIGTVGVFPNLIILDTTDTLATITTAGYLTQLVHQGAVSIYFHPETTNPNTLALVGTATGGPVLLQVTVTGNAPNLIYSLSPTTQSGGIFAGNVQAGSNGVPGHFISYPPTMNSGTFNFTAANNVGNTVTTFTNAAMGQATTITVPDPGVAAASVLLTQNAGTQTIATGSLALTVGTLVLGSSNHASSLTIFPPTAARGFFEILPIAAAGAFNTIVSNAAIGQTTTYTIPDPGVAAASFLLTQNAGTQTIATGSLALTVGSVTATAGNFIAGNAAGPHPGNLQSFPAASGGANDKFEFAAVTTGGNFTTTLSNGAMGQATTFVLPDPANAAAQVLVGATATPFTANHSLVASGTAGLIADAGYQMKTVAQAAVAGGAAAQTVMDAFCTAGSMVTASWNDTSNAVTIQKVAAGNGSFVVTSSGDPGASHINYIITKV